MGRNNVDVSSLKNYLEQYAREVGRVTAASIRDELAETAFNAIVKFYESYSPRTYRRHYYNFLEKSFRKYYSNAHGIVYRGGIEFTPQLMDDIYQSSRGYSPSQVTEQVFDTVYAGFHGVASTQIYPGSSPRYSPPVMRPSPMELILSKRDEIEDNLDRYIQKAQLKVKI